MAWVLGQGRQEKGWWCQHWVTLLLRLQLWLCFGVAAEMQSQGSEEGPLAAAVPAAAELGPACLHPGLAHCLGQHPVQQCGWALPYPAGALAH